MAAKLKCPQCGKILKEYGDRAKDAEGFYRVYDSLQNSKEKPGSHRIVECFSCKYFWRP